MIWIIFLLPVLIFAQVDIFGYYESEYDYLQLQNSDYNFGYNKLRLDLESKPSDQVMIAGNISFQLYHGKTDWDLIDFIPKSIGESEFQIQVFDSNGRHVETVFQGHTKSGMATFNWNALGQASGTYFIRLDVDGSIYSQKIQLIK